jgi:hypothetical protein
MKSSRKSCKNNKILVSTLNVRTLSNNAYFSEFENALKKINYDIIGLSEVKRIGEDFSEHKDFLFYYNGLTRKRGSVGFVINKKWKDKIKSIQSISDRVAVLILNVTKDDSIGIIQVYAPTSKAKEEEMKIFYDDVEEAQALINDCEWKVVMGDWNSKIGSRSTHERDVMGPFGYGTRNERGERLIRFCRKSELFIGNTLFKKRLCRKWTWSLDLQTKNEIDFILTPARNKNLITNVEVLNKFDFSTDHRMVRMTLKLKNPKKLFKTFQHRVKVNPSDLETVLKFNVLAKKNLANATNYDEFHKILLESAKMFKTPNNQHPIITSVSKELIAKREKLREQAQNNPSAKPEYYIVRKETKQSIRRDVRNYDLLKIDEAIRNNKCLKVAKDGIVKKQWIQSLRDNNGIEQKDRSKIVNVASDFYKDLYTSKLPIRDEISSPASGNFDHEVPEITLEEIKSAIAMMKTNKSYGDDGLPIDLLKVCDDSILMRLKNLFNDFLKNEQVPSDWHVSKIILIFKKGDKKDIKNYRPISIITHVSKLFCKIILNRIDQELDDSQSRDQAGFRKTFSTSDHLLVVSQIMEKYQEYQKPIHIAFIDYTKAFDCVETSCLIDALRDQKVKEKYIRMINHLYSEATARIQMDNQSSATFNLGRGVKQGDPLSPKLFNCLLEYLFKNLNWKEKGIAINEKWLSNLRFADDVALFSESKDDLLAMIEDLRSISSTAGLEINMDKSKIITNTDEKEYKINATEIELVEDFKYLGKIVSFHNGHSKEVDARVSAAWRSFWGMKKFLISDLPMYHKRKLMNSVVLPTFTYGCQTWTLSRENERKLACEQRAMERKLLKISRLDHIPNSRIREITKLTDVVTQAKQLKWNFSGHIQRLSDERWTKLIENWTPTDGKRKRGHQVKRWSDEIEEIGLGRWREKAQDRKLWKVLGATFVHKWTDL